MNFYLISLFAAAAAHHHVGSSVAVGMPTTTVVQPMVTSPIVHSPVVHSPMVQSVVASPIVPTLRAVPVGNVMSPLVSHTSVIPSVTSSYVTDVLPTTTHYLRGPTTIGTYGGSIGTYSGYHHY
eukprot:Protomagalhaensia_wolfi_Nauph_80__5271@NODE_568_length_2276_cov_743_156907_g424_i0_p3_GENE_NODE_568_length_2276_cov_743_156907_g424_i0NODE_568_length_2276_cov_743_156907_g424_i0_p3_ORF_typecomplete_len124_score14_01_NODE_568_length_2276_cov_743_156907_g424_i011551526